jgi:quinol monooxygenase YgiN
MGYVLIIHEVEDYQEWKRGFDSAAELRKGAGELEYQVLQYDGELNRVVHFSKWESHSRAKFFFESEEVQKIRDELGVKRPEFIYLNQTESGIL